MVGFIGQALAVAPPFSLTVILPLMCQQEVYSQEQEEEDGCLDEPLEHASDDIASFLIHSHATSFSYWLMLEVHLKRM